MKYQKNNDLVVDAVAARGAGMTYGQFQAKKYLSQESIREKRIREGKHNSTIRNGKGGL